MPITALFFILIYLILAIMAFTKRPIYGLYGYLFAFYMHPPSKYWGYALPELRWSLIIAVITLMALFLKKEKDEKFILFYFRETKLFFAFVLYVLIQYFWAWNTIIHTEYIFMSFKFLLLIIVIQNCIKDEKDVIQFIIVNLLGAAYVSYIGISQHAGGRFEGIGGPGLSETNEISQHLGVILIMSSYLLLCKLKKSYWLIVLPIALLLNAIMYTQSRGAILALVLAAVVAIFYAPKNVKKQFFMFALLGGVVFSVLLGPRMIERFNGLQINDDGAIKEKSANTRIVVIKAQWEMFKENPIFGYGHKGTIFLSSAYIPREYLTSGIRASHNFIMAILVDHGVIGAALYFSVIISCIRRMQVSAKKTLRSERSRLIRTLIIGVTISLVFLMLGGFGANNKVMEVDIWLYALIPLLYKWLHLESLPNKSN